jgi:type IV secretion system protein VirB10
MSQIKPEKNQAQDTQDIDDIKPTIANNEFIIKPLKKSNKTKKILIGLGLLSAVGVVGIAYAKIALKNKSTKAVATKAAQTNKIENTSTKKFDKLPEVASSTESLVVEQNNTQISDTSISNAYQPTATFDATPKPHVNTFIENQYSAPIFKQANNPNNNTNQSNTNANDGTEYSQNQYNQQSQVNQSYQSNQNQDKTSNLDDSGTKAKIIKNPQLKVAEGTILNATLKTRIDSTLKGKVIATLNDDVYSMDGSTLLIERGSELIGDALSDVREGSERLSVIWSSLRTPNNIRIKLNSLGTDTLGGAGFSGSVNHQYGKRFGSAMLLSILDDVINATLSKNANITNNIQNSQQQGRNIAEQILNNSININPIMYLNQGKSISIIAASDLDFSDVYKFKLKHNE